MKFNMPSGKFTFRTWLLAIPVAAIAGCGGSNSGPIVTPTATPIVTGTPGATPTATTPANALTGRIVYGNANGRIVLVNADGTNQRVLGSGRQPVLSPDGSRVAFVGDGGLQVISSSGGNATRLVNDDTATFPVWSFDGTKLAYVSRKNSPGFTTGIWVVDANGANARQLTVGRTETIGAVSNFQSDGVATWYPSGQLLTFSRTNGFTASGSSVGGRSGSRLFNLTLSGEVRDARVRGITENFTQQTSPDWNRDGQKLAFYDSPSLAAGSVFIKNGAQTQRRLAIEGTTASAAKWSPDGRYLLVTTPNGLIITDENGNRIATVAEGTNLSGDWSR